MLFDASQNNSDPLSHTNFPAIEKEPELIQGSYTVETSSELNESLFDSDQETTVENAIRLGLPNLSSDWSSSLKFIFSESIRGNKINFLLNFISKATEKLIPYGLWGGIGLGVESAIARTSLEPAIAILITTASLSLLQKIFGPHIETKFKELQKANLDETFYKAIPNYRAQELGTDFLSSEQIIVRDHYSCLAEFFNNSLSVLNSAGAFTTAFIAILPVNKYLGCAMLFTLLPRLWAEFAYAQDYSKLVDKLSDNDRQLEYLNWMYVDNDQIIEVKGLQQHENIVIKTMGLLMNKVNGYILNSWSHLKRSVLVECLDHAVMYGGIVSLFYEVAKAPSAVAQSILPFYALTYFRDEVVNFGNTLGEQARHRPFIRRIVGFMTKHSNDEDYQVIVNKIDWKDKLPEIKLKNVSVKHLGAEEATISDVNLTIKPGSVVAILGEIGSGKSTLVGTIEGRYRLASGEVLADDHNIQSIRQEWRTHTRRLDQDYCLFKSFTFRQILEMGINPFGDPAQKPVIENVAKQTGLHDILKKKSAGYDTRNGQGLGKFSTDLSGGQEQLVALTRTVLGQPDIVILDEPTASLDASRSKELEDFILKNLKGKTVIIVTHNMGSARKLADQVVWLESGKVVENGSPQELLKIKGGCFRKMYIEQAKAYRKKKKSKVIKKKADN